MTIKLRLKNFVPLPTPVVAVSLIVTPVTATAILGQTGGPFAPSSFTYSVSTPFSSVGYTITAPPWLDVSAPTGTASAAPSTITFTANAAANALAAGNYSGSITFNNTSFSQTPIVISITIEVIQFPAGAIGAWYADQYQAAPNPVVPNSLSAVVVSQNIIRAPRRLFDGSNFWILGDVTAVDDAAVGPDGLTQASSIDGTGGLDWAVFLSSVTAGTAVPFPAGTYTVGINVMRNTGSDQSFAILVDGAVVGGTRTATSAWQRFTATFTLTATTHNIRIGPADGTTGALLLICDFEMFVGSSDLGPEVLGGHLYLGSTAYNNQPTAGGGYIDLSADGLGLIQFPLPVTLTTWTVSAVVNQVAAGVSVQALLEDAKDANNFEVFNQFNNINQQYPAASFSGISLNTNQAQQVPGFWDPIGEGPHVYTWRYDGTNWEFFFDDVRVAYAASASITPTDIANMMLTFSALGKTLSLKVGAIVMWDRALSNAEIYNTIDILTIRVSPSYTITPWQYFYFPEGDSVTSGNDVAIYSFAYRYTLNSSQKVFGYNYAQAGGGLTDMEDRFDFVAAGLPPANRRTGRFFLMSILIGSNDLGSGNGAAEAASLATYIEGVVDAGFTIYTGTILDRNLGAPWIADALAFNSIVVSNVSAAYGTVVDFAADANLGPPGSGVSLNVVYFTDGTHPSQVGHNLMESIIRPYLDAGFA